MHGVEWERRAAQEAVQRLSNTKAYLLRGTVSALDGEGHEGRLCLRLRGCTIEGPRGKLGLPGFVQLSGYEYGPSKTPLPDYVPGDQVSAPAVLSLPEGLANFAGFDLAEYLAVQRIYVQARLQSVHLVRREARRGSALDRLVECLARLRRLSTQALGRELDPHQARLTASMFFNDRQLLSEEDKKIFRDSGTMHLFAVSGLHVAIFGFLLNLVFRSLRFGPRASWSAVCLVLGLYVVMLDFIAPALRSFLMVLAYTLGQWMGREVDNLCALTFGAAIILLADPLAAWQASFLLSLMGVAGIFLFVPLLGELLGLKELQQTDGWLARLGLWIADGLLVSLSVMLTILPLQFFYFQQVNLLGAVCNVVVGPLSGLVLGAAIPTITLYSPLEPLARLSGAACSALMWLIYELSVVTARQSWAILYVPRPPLFGVFSYYAILFSGYYMVRRDTPEFFPKSQARLAIHATAAAAVLFTLTCWPSGSQRLRVWFLDVGQGDATLIEFPGGQTLLVDAGKGRPDAGKLVIEPQLNALGLRPLDNLLATHFDEDHVGGMGWLVEHFPMETLISGASSLSTAVGGGVAGDLLSSATRQGLRLVEVRAGPALRLDSLTTLEVLNPDPAVPGSAVSDNARSVVLRVRHGDVCMLLMGDAEQEVEERLLKASLGRCDILKVGHHGSRHASTALFLSALRPKVAVVSCGRRNRYGHPAPEVLERLKAVGTRVFRTDVHGAILLESDARQFWIRTARAKPSQ